MTSNRQHRKCSKHWLRPWAVSGSKKLFKSPSRTNLHGRPPVHHNNKSWLSSKREKIGIQREEPLPGHFSLTGSEDWETVWLDLVTGVWSWELTPNAQAGWGRAHLFTAPSPRSVVLSAWSLTRPRNSELYNFTLSDLFQLLCLCLVNISASWNPEDDGS